MIPWLKPNSIDFPSVDTALSEPNGLLAAGGNLSKNRLISAYKQGIFPWYNQDEPILWWSPAPRCVLLPQELHVSKSLAKCIRQEKFNVTFDQNFLQVIEQCSLSRKDREGTWITEQMIQAYYQLFVSGYAHSVEVWHNKQLVGGLYGLAIGSVFYGESMFSYQSNASKVALHALAKKLDKEHFSLIDCQVYSAHLASLGAREISREAFVSALEQSNETCIDIISYWNASAS